MFLADLPNVLLRWWYIVVAGVVCTVGLALFTLKVVPPTYHATAEVLILPPSTAVPKGGNPYLALGGLNAIGGVLSTALTDDKTVSELKAAGSNGEYTVGLDQLSPAPMLVVTADEPTAERSLETVQTVLDRLPGVLQGIQVSASVPTDSFITTTLITKSDKAAAQHKSQLRAVLVAVAAGLVGTLMVTAFVNALFPKSRRGRRRPIPQRARTTSDAAAGTPPPNDTDDVLDPARRATPPRRRIRVAPTSSSPPASPPSSGETVPSHPRAEEPYSAVTSVTRHADGDRVRSEYSTRGS